MFLLSISRRHYLKVLLQKAIFIVFLGLYYYPSPTWLSDLTSSLFKNLKKIIFRSPDLMISLTTSMIMVSSQTYQKFSSNGLDLAELEPKPVGHRQIPTDPVLHLGQNFA
jgi:hypothetical protein